MTKAIFLDYTGTITQENCKAVQEVVMRIVKNSALKTSREALLYWWSNLKQMEEVSYLDAGQVKYYTLVIPCLPMLREL